VIDARGKIDRDACLSSAKISDLTGNGLNCDPI
jgi:hypothetical protein